MPKIKIRDNLQGKAGLLSHYLQDTYELKTLPDISISLAGEIDVDAKITEDQLKEAVTKFRKTKHAGHPYKRALELLDKPKLTPEEDDELKKLHRQWLRTQLGG